MRKVAYILAHALNVSTFGLLTVCSALITAVGAWIRASELGLPAMGFTTVFALAFVCTFHTVEWVFEKHPEEERKSDDRS